MLERGADIAVQDNDNWTSLHWACFDAHAGIVHLLLETGADVNARNKDDDTPLDQLLRLSTSNPAREEIIDLFRQHHPEMVMEAWCSPGLQP